MSSVTDRLCTCVFLLWRQLLGCSALICMHMLNAAHCGYWDGRLLWIFAVCCTECICRDKWSVRTRQGHRRLPHICTNCCNSLYLCIVNWKDRFIFLHGVVVNSILVSVAVDWHVILEVVSLLRHAAMVLACCGDLQSRDEIVRCSCVWNFVSSWLWWYCCYSHKTLRLLTTTVIMSNACKLIPSLSLNSNYSVKICATFEPINTQSLFGPHFRGAAGQEVQTPYTGSAVARREQWDFHDIDERILR